MIHAAIQFTGMSLWLSLLLALTACASTGGYISGQVLDAETKVPIADAHVVIIWKGAEFAVVETKTVCVYADGTVTDVNGNFSFSPWVKPDGLFPISDIRNQILVYKQGYEEVRVWRRTEADRQYLLKHFDGLRKEHLEYLLNLPRRISCHQGGSSQKNLSPLFEAVYYEAKTLSITADDKKKLDRFRWIAASYAIGGDKNNYMNGSEYDKLIEDYLEDHLQ